MSADKPDTPGNSEDPDDAPEWDAEAFARAERRHGDQRLRPAQATLTRRGRLKSEDPRQLSRSASTAKS